jgi:hypothetical protein
MGIVYDIGFTTSYLEDHLRNRNWLVSGGVEVYN